MNCSYSSAFTFHYLSALMLPTITGAVYLQDCPQQCYIPVYVLVCGVFIIFLLLLSCLPCTTETEEERQRSFIRNVLKCLVSVILVCWMICGSVWIYSVYPPNYNQTMAGDAYCNKTLYLFAFWTTILGNILFGLVLLCGCCVWGKLAELVYCVALALD
uniref:Si:dkey-19b23.12 n=1 Tax=Cyprinus carpio TaxID=7962 RepID=A0A8C1RUB0_CYPCA